jgi:hypothetical protein
MRARLRKMAGLPRRRSMLLRIIPVRCKAMKYAKQEEFAGCVRDPFVAHCSTMPVD